MVFLADIHFPTIILFLVWLAMAGMSFWVWTGTKGTPPLLTLIGSGIFALQAFLLGFGITYEFASIWLTLAASVLIVLGYYFTVKPVVDKHLHDLRAKKGSAPAS